MYFEHHFFLLHQCIQFQYLNDMLIDFIPVFTDRLNQFLVKLNDFYFFYFSTLIVETALINEYLVLFNHLLRVIVNFEVLILQLWNFNVFNFLLNETEFMFINNLTSIQIIHFEHFNE